MQTDKSCKMLIFLDVKSANMDDTNQICSIGLLCEDTAMYDLCNDGVKISPKASAIHNITNEMIQNKPPLKETQSYKFLEKHNNKDTTIIIHSTTPFIQNLLYLDLKYKGCLIDTLRVSRHLMPECEFYSLEFLRYELKLYRSQKEFVPYHSLDDAKTIKLLYNYLQEFATTQQMCELTFKNVLLEKFDFGKYAGRYIEEIAQTDRKYLQWIISSGNFDEDIIYSVSHYLQN